MSGDEEQHSCGDEREPGHDSPSSTDPELWNFARHEPDSGDDDQQERDFGESDARLMADRQQERHSLQLSGSCRGLQARRGPSPSCRFGARVDDRVERVPVAAEER